MDSSTGDLIWNHPMIQGDLKAIQDPSRSTPCSAIGYLTVALEQRRVDATEPFTVLSCDNVPENGRIIKKAIHTLAHRAMDQATFSKFVEYIDGQCRFPSTMVRLEDDQGFPAVDLLTPRVASLEQIPAD